MCSVQTACDLTCTLGELGTIAKYNDDDGMMGSCVADATKNNDDFCGISMCCQGCLELMGAYQGCLYMEYACDTSCKKYLPPAMLGPVAAPSPVVDFPPSGGGDDDDDDYGVSISPECANKQKNFEACTAQNYQTCEASFSSCMSAEPLEEATLCQSMDQICHDISCCAACAAIGKEFVECEFRVRGCDGDCSNLPIVVVNKNQMMNHKSGKMMMMMNKTNKMMMKKNKVMMNKSDQMKMANVMKSVPKMGSSKGAKATGSMKKKKSTAPTGHE